MNLSKVINFLLILLLIFSTIIGCDTDKNNQSLIDENNSKSTDVSINPGASEAKPEKNNKDLKVLLSTPNGKITDLTQIVVLFNQPMVAITSLDQQAKEEYFQIKPNIKGKYHWLGTTMLAFQPDKVLPMATEYEVTIESGLKSYAGIELKDNVKFNFNTPELEIINHRTNSTENYIILSPEFYIQFNQTVSIERAKSFISLSDESKNIVSVKVFRPVSKEKKDFPNLESWIAVAPTSELKKATKYKLTIKKGLTGDEGTLGIPEDKVYDYETYGALVVNNDYSGEKCPQSITIDFSNPVKHKEFMAHLSTEPKINFSKTQNEDDQENEDSDDTSNYSSTYQYAVGDIKASSKYTVTISAGLKDIYGNELKQPYTYVLTTADISGILSLEAYNGILEANGKTEIPLDHLNIDSPTLKIAKLKDKEAIKYIKKGYHEIYDKNEEKNSEDKINYIVNKKLTLKSEKNKAYVTPIDLKPALGDDKYGIFFVKVNKDNVPNCYSEPQDLSDSSIIQITNIALCIKYSQENMIVLATSLDKGEPIDGVEINIKTSLNKSIWTGKTNNKGVASAPGYNDIKEKLEKDDFYVFAEKDGDKTILASNWDNGINGWSFNLPTTRLSSFPEMKGFIFSERAAYRPGEEVHFKGIIRGCNYGELVPIKEKKLVYEVVNNNGDKLTNGTLKISDFGTFNLSFSTPIKARVGGYTVNVKSPETGEQLHGYFDVEEYKAPDFEVKITGDRPEYIFGETMNIGIEGKYLFGEPMSEATLRWEMNRHKYYFSTEGYESYTFGNETDWYLNNRNDDVHDRVQSGSEKLDKKGYHNLIMKLTPGTISDSYTYALETEVVDINSQAVASREYFTVHRGKYYIGLKPDKSIYEAGQKINGKLVTLDPNGKPFKGSSIKLKIDKREWHTIRQKGMGSGLRYINEPVDKTVYETTIDGSTQIQNFEYTIEKSGEYIIKATGTDDLNNTIATSTSLYVCGKDQVSWGREDHDRIELKADKKMYSIGDTAKITLKSPYDSCYAVITKERNKINKHYTKHIEGSTPLIEIPIDDEDLPNIYISVLLIKGRTTEEFDKDGTDIGKPSFKLGYINLPINTEAHRLKVNISSDNETYQPGQKVNLNLSVDNKVKAGKSELAIMVVDSAVLNLTGFITPNPFAYFYQNQDLAIENANSLMHVVERRHYGKKGEAPGGGGEKGSGATQYSRYKFKTCAYWNPSVETDDNGNAQVSFNLPYNLTKYRIMVIANSKVNEFGSNEKYINVKKPLMLRASLPRFINVGDNFSGGVTIHNYTDRGGKVELNVSAKDIDLLSNAKTTVDIDKEGSAEVLFNFKADKIGKGELTFNASLNGQNDGLILPLNVQAPEANEVVAHYGTTKDKSEQFIEVPKNARNDIGGLDVTMASTALVKIERAVKYLLQYPYGCLEQISSRLLTLIYFKDFILQFNLPEFDRTKINDSITENIQKIYSCQKYDGGFSFWAETSHVSPYLSAYAMMVLKQAKENGYKVNEDVITNGIKYLKETQKSDFEKKQNITLSYSDKSFIAYVLALYKEFNSSYLDKIYKDKKNLATVEKAFIAISYQLEGKNKDKVKTLKSEIYNKAVASTAGVHLEEASGYNYYFNSNIRTSSIGLLFLLISDEDNEMIPKMVNWLISSTLARGYATNTHDTAFMNMALAKYFKTFEGEDTNFEAKATLKNNTICAEKFKTKTTMTKLCTMSMEELIKAGDGSLNFEKTGSGMLYYSASLKYFKKELYLPPVDEGFAVSTSFKKISTNNSKTEFNRGDVIRVDVTVAVPMERDYVVISCPIPAGLEPINLKFQTSTQGLGRYLTAKPDTSSSEGESEEGYSDYDVYNYFYHAEQYDDRVVAFADYLPKGIYTYSFLVRATTPGNYLLPASKVEEMYNPETFGRGPTRNLIVNK